MGPAVHADMPPGLDIRLFGPFEVRVNGEPLARLRSRVGQWLLALLVLRHERPLDRDWLAQTLWPDSSEEQAHYNLRRNLTDLRRALGPEAARLQSPAPRTLRFDLISATCDLVAFDEAVARGDEASLEEAVALYSGPLLEECAEDWALSEREAREQAYLNALETLAARAAARDDSAEAAGYLRRVVAVDPTRESAQRTLMEALAAVGDQAAVTQAYHRFRLYLHSEINAQPSPETVALYKRLQDEARASPPHTPILPHAHTPTRHLPRPRTSLIGREEERQEVAAALRAARLVTLTGTGGVGKTRLTIAVAEDVAGDYPGGVWFVDLAPLTDQTQVTRAVAAVLGVREEPGRTLMEMLQDALQPRSLLLILDNCEHLVAECARLADSLLEGCPGLRILATSRQSLRVPGERVWPVPSLPVPDFRFSFSDFRSAEGKTKIENEKSKIEKDGVSFLMDYDAVRLFVERASWVGGRFQLTPYNVSAVAEICSHLDGMPLAIELAAAQTPGLSVAQIAAHLDDRFRFLTRGSRTALPRHQTLRATLDWSYDLLSDRERTLLCRLSVFAGGWTLEAAETVCAGDWVIGLLGDREAAQSPYDVLDLLTWLVDKSLVVYEEQGGNGRYRLLETVREYSRERLRKNPDDVAVLPRRHAEYYLRLAQQAGARLLGKEHAQWSAQLDLEHDNLRAALSWSLNEPGYRVSGIGYREEADPTPDPRHPTADAEIGLRLALSLWRFWWIRGYFSEGREWLAAALRNKGMDHPTEEIADLLRASSALAMSQGDFVQALSLCQQAQTLSGAIGYRKGEAFALLQRGLCWSNQGDYEAARPLLEEALSVCREIGDLEDEAECLGNLGYLAREQGDYAEARALLEQALRLSVHLGNHLEEAAHAGSLSYVFYYQGDYAQATALLERTLAVYRDFGMRVGEAWTLNSLGFLAGEQGDYTRALSWAEQALVINRELDNRPGQAWNLSLIGDLYRQVGDYAKAQAALEQSLALCRQTGSRSIEVAVHLQLGNLYRDRGDHAAARRLYVETAGLMRSLGLNNKAIGVVEAFAELAARAGHSDLAVRLYGAAETAHKTLGFVLAPTKYRRQESHLAALRAALGEEAFAAAWAEGQAMTLEQAAAYAVLADGTQ